MEILEAAITFEKEGEAFYWELADKTDNRGIKNICLMLARDEVEHAKVIEKLMGNRPEAKADSTIIEDVKTVFRRFIDDIFDPDEALAEESMYLKAMTLEKKMIDFYSERAKEASVENVKSIFLTLAGEEEKHYEILKNILEFRRNTRDWVQKRIFDSLGGGAQGDDERSNDES
jgi:rubrerythrin